MYPSLSTIVDDCQSETEFYCDMMIKGEDSLNLLNADGYSPLHEAILNRNLKKIERLIEIGADIELPTSSGEHPIHLACISLDPLKVIRLLIYHGANINVPDKNGAIILIKAIESNNLELVKLLLELGSDISLQFYSHQYERKFTSLSLSLFLHNSPIINLIIQHVNINSKHTMGVEEVVLYLDDVLSLEILVEKKFLEFSEKLHEKFIFVHYAANYNSVECFKYMHKICKNLIQKSIQEEFVINPIHIAAQKGNYEILELITCYNPNSINMPSSYGLAPLHYACQKSNFKIIKFLVDNGADVNVKSEIGQTPLHIAAQNNQYENVRLLISYNADPNQISLDGGFTALHISCNSISYESAALLIKRQANINLQSKNGYSAIHLASLKNAFKICYLLCQQDDINLRLLTKEGYTSLHFACFIGSHSIADCLLKFDRDLIDIATEDKRHETPMFIAVKSRNLLLTKTLLSFNPNMEIKDAKKGFNPLHLSIHLKLYDLTAEICAKFSYSDEINIPNNNGLTPLLLAVYNLSFNFIKLLIDHGSDITATTNSGESILVLAIINRDYQYLRSLTGLLSKQQLKSIINFKTKQGLLAIHFAALNGCVEKFKIVYEICRKFSIDLNIPLVHFCVSKNNIELLQYLIKQQFNVMAKLNGGFSSAHYAAYYGSFDCLKLLLQHFPKFLTIKSDNGLTLLHMCQFKSNIKCAEYLIEHANFDIINCQSNNGFTVLHYACYFNQNKMIEFLLENGSNANILSKTNQLALEIALIRGIDQPSLQKLVNYTGRVEHSYIVDKIEDHSNLGIKLDIFEIPDIFTSFECKNGYDEFNNLSTTLNTSQESGVSKKNIKKIINDLNIFGITNEKEIISYNDFIDPYMFQENNESVLPVNTLIDTPVKIYPLKKKISQEYLFLQNNIQKKQSEPYSSLSISKIDEIFEKNDKLSILDLLMKVLNESDTSETFQNTITPQENGSVAIHESGLLRFIFLPNENLSKLKIHVKMVELSVLNSSKFNMFSSDDWIANFSYLMPIILKFNNVSTNDYFYHVTLPLFVSIMNPQWSIKPLISDDGIEWVFPHHEVMKILNIPEKFKTVSNENESNSLKLFGLLSNKIPRYIAFEISPCESLFKNQVLDDLKLDELTFTAFQNYSVEGHKISACIKVPKGGSNSLVEHLRFFYLQCFSNSINLENFCSKNSLIYCSPIVFCSFNRSLNKNSLETLQQAYRQDKTKYNFPIIYSVEFENLIPPSSLNFEPKSKLITYILTGISISKKYESIVWNNVTDQVNIINQVSSNIFQRNGISFESSFIGPHIVIVCIENNDEIDKVKNISQENSKIFDVANLFYHCIPFPRNIFKICVLQKVLGDDSNVFDSIGLKVAIYPLFQNEYFDSFQLFTDYEKIYLSPNFYISKEFMTEVTIFLTNIRNGKQEIVFEFKSTFSDNFSETFDIILNTDRDKRSLGLNINEYPKNNLIGCIEKMTILRDVIMSDY